MKPLVILQVEDREEDVLLLKHAFKRAGIDGPLHVVNNGQAAIDYLAGTGEYGDRTRHPLPCLVLLDLKLPMRTGLETLEWIKKHPEFRSIIVMILSSSIDEGDVRKAYALGANAFLVKPSDLDVLTDMCRALRAFWLNFNQPPLICGESGPES